MTTISESIPLSRREREKLVQRRLILDTALELFADRGYHSVTMHEIAGAAEFAIGSLYSFFTNKEDLYRAIMLEMAGKFQRRLGEARTSGSDELEKLSNFVKAKGEVFIENIASIRLYMAETRGASFNLKAGLDGQIREMHEEGLRHLATIFESGQRRGVFAPGADPYLLACALDAVTNTALLLALFDPERHPCEQRMGDMLKIFLEPVRLKQ